MKRLILLSGLPGSGKSTYAKAFFATAKVIDSDSIRKRHTGTFAKMLPNMSLVYDEMIEKANLALQEEGDFELILDSTFLDEKRRRYFLSRIQGQDETILVMLKAHNLQTVLRQNGLRDPEKRVKEDVIREMASRFAEPDGEEAKLYTEVKIVWID